MTTAITAHYDESPRTANYEATTRIANYAGVAQFLFILSTERSGSTLLSLMLGGHSSVISPPELHLMAYPTVDEWLQKYPTAMKSLSFLFASLGLTMDRKQIEEKFSGWPPESLYGWIAAQPSARAQIIVDKTPKYARYPAVLHRTAKLEPLYIWLIRHPLGVAASQIALRQDQRKKRSVHFLAGLNQTLLRLRDALRKREHVEKEVAYWTWVNTQIEQFLAMIAAERWRQVHFEELVKEPHVVMDRLCRWLGVPFEAPMLDPQAHIPAALDPTLGDPKVRHHANIDTEVAESWRKHYPEQLLDSFTGRTLGVPTREAMARWGIQGP